MMFFTESLLTEDHFLAEYVIENYQKPVTYIHSHGGIVAYIRENISFREIQSPVLIDDVIWIETLTRNKVKRLYGCIYRSPNSTA